MKKYILLILGLIIIVFIFIYPSIEFYKDNYLYMMSYGNTFDKSEDLKQLEEEFCYDESYSYNKKRNISIKSWDYNGFLFFKWFKIKYEKGNVCETEYLLEESYVKHFIENAEIISNKDDVDLAKLIEGKTAIVGNKKYSFDDNYKYIEFRLDDKYMDMYIFVKEDGLIIIQVGLSDEGPKFIAYK